MSHFRRAFVAATAAVVTAFASAATAAIPTTRPVPAIDHVVIMSVDGCRPDLLLRADTPTLHGLLAKSSFSFWARTTAESITLPSHTSMLTGVTPVRHQIQWNRDLPFLHAVYPAVPTIFQLAHIYRYTTAMVAGKIKFNSLAVPASLDWQWIAPTEKVEDPEVTTHAVSIIRQHQPQVLFIHFPSTDSTGHQFGWASPEQMAALAGVDRDIRQVLDAIDGANLTGRTFVIITADHGGAGKSHGPDDPRSRHIPWIAFGPHIRRGLDLTTDARLTIDTEDTFATACYMLGVHWPTSENPLDGKPVTEIIERDELLQPTSN